MLLTQLVTSWWGRSGSPSFRTRLVGEELEVRCVPAAAEEYIWAPTFANNNYLWSTLFPGGGTNWLVYKTGPLGNKYWARSEDKVPGADDNVYFVGAWEGEDRNAKCIVDLPTTVHSMTARDGYSSRITLAMPLTISGTDDKSFLALKSPATLSGQINQDGVKVLRGTLVLDKQGLSCGIPAR